MATNPLSLFAIQPGDEETPSSDMSKTDLISRQSGALQKLISSLGQKNSNYFSIAGQLFDPGRTGSAGEALGRASSEIGKQQELRDQQAPNIAMLKAQLLNQEYQMGLQKQGMSMLGNIMGTSPDEAVNRLQTGEIPPSLGRIADPRQVVGLMATYKPYGEALRAGIELQQKDVENSLKLLASGIDITKATENLSPAQKEDFLSNLGGWAAKLGFTIPGPKNTEQQPTTSTPATGTQRNVPEPTRNISDISSILGNGLTLSSGYGTRQDPFNKSQTQTHAHLDFSGKLGTEIKSFGNGTVVKAGVNGGYGNYVEVKDDKGATTFYGHLNNIDPNIKEGDIVRQGQIIGTLGSTGRSTGPHLAFGMRDAKGNPVNPMERIEAAKPVLDQSKNKPSSGIQQRQDETPAAFRERKAKIEEPQLKDIAEIASGLNKVDRGALKTSNVDLSELREIANRPDASKIFAPLQLQGGESYAQAATKVAGRMLDKGVGLTVQNLNIQLGLPFKDFYQNLNLTAEQKVIAERAKNIIAQQVINNIIANKTAAFGGSRVTNYQDQQLSELNASMDNLPKYIGGWALRRQVDNASLIDTHDEWLKYQRSAYKNNQVSDPRDFLYSDIYLKDLPSRHATMLKRVQEAFK